MSLTSPVSDRRPIVDHETARDVQVARTAAALERCGLTSAEASRLTAHLLGLPAVTSGWTLRQLEHLVFLRTIVESGRLGA
jgi:hypothetical protein